MFLMKLTLNGLKVFEFVKHSGTWVGVDEIIHHTGVNINAANRWLQIWTKQGLMSRNDTFRAYLYRLAEEYENTQMGEKVDTALRIFKELEGENGNRSRSLIKVEEDMG